MSSKKKMERLQVYLEPELKEALTELARQEGVSLAEIVRCSLRQTVRQVAGKISPALSIVGMFRADPNKLDARNHDKIIYQREGK